MQEPELVHGQHFQLQLQAVLKLVIFHLSFSKVYITATFYAIDLINTPNGS